MSQEVTGQRLELGLGLGNLNQVNKYGLQWVKDQLKFKKNPIKIFYFVSFHFCSSHLSSVYLLLFHIYYNFISISFQCHFNFLSISFYLFIFFCFILLITFSVLYFSIPFCTLLYFI